ncbi:hypothetical protein LJC71_03215 [Desulfosarcina sp. OttesenSCG-928-A07]|nr:hypothetical protein [Desulfosarcina sp. OttesenSCG-928-G17]MDL2328746.1 hypothetical protein [Desulfosarcina sp. OttesenSCG-928-A07]
MSFSPRCTISSQLAASLIEIEKNRLGWAFFHQPFLQKTLLGIKASGIYYRTWVDGISACLH